MSTIDTISTSTSVYGNSSETAGIAGQTKGGNVFTRLVNLFELWQERRHSRIVLSRLTDRELADIGISKSQADFESSKPFWESSVNRMR